MSIKNKKIVGQGLDRVDGWLKVTGQARYAADFSAGGLTYAVTLNSTIAAGRITRFNTTEAGQQPGVLAIITHENAYKLDVSHPFSVAVLQDDQIRFHGQIIALVIAETFEQARFASRLIRVSYSPTKPRIGFDHYQSEIFRPAIINAGHKTDSQLGNAEQGLHDAAITVDHTYDTVIQHHHPMETHSIVADWQQDHLQVYLSTQHIMEPAEGIAAAFRIERSKVRLLGPYVGGGFGGKIRSRENCMLAVMGSRHIRRPVKLVFTRQQMFMNTGLRQQDRQRIQLGAAADGTLTALVHESVTHTSMHEDFIEQCGALSRILYNVPNSKVTHRAFRLNVQTPCWMRAPGEAPGSFALESAMDELAFKLKIDPVQLRLKNDTLRDLDRDRPFSSRHLTECLKAGAEKFGWKDYNAEPRSKRNGDWLIGYGMSTTSRSAPFSTASATLKIELSGDQTHVVIGLSGTDIGTGTYTIVAQTTAELLRLPMSVVTVQLGDSDLPKAPGSGGSSGAAAYAGAVYAVCEKAWQQLKGGLKPGDVAHGLGIPELLQKNGMKKATFTHTSQRPDGADQYSSYAFGANYAEVQVDEKIGKIRVTRFVSSIAAGRILNPKTACSQIMGGIVWGLGMALMEESVLDEHHGNFITRSFADYHVPVHLDIGSVEVVFVEEDDNKINPMGVKGLGELGIIGVAAAVANAVFNATGKRIRSLPITPDKIL